MLELRSPDYCQIGPYQWLDDTLLLFYPLTAQEEGMGTTDWSYPLLPDLYQQHIWTPDLNSRRPIRNCMDVLRWSPSGEALAFLSARDLYVVWLTS